MKRVRITISVGHIHPAVHILEVDDDLAGDDDALEDFVREAVLSGLVEWGHEVLDA